ncbi:MAG: mucoidy inhibitor MuiA family protein [Planctomycetes bacterium]|nr:mucoidy inhibitor MuiA family protein [Planctomycetota bacterium]
MRPDRALAVLALFAALALSPAFGQGENGSATSKISHVVVYPQSAEVTREREVEVSVGLNQVPFSGLVANLDAGTLRASTDEGVDVVGIETQTRYLTEPLSRQVAELDAKIREQADLVREVEWTLKRLEEERAFYGTIRTATLQSIQDTEKGKALSIEEWQRIMTFVREGMEGSDKSRLAIEEDLRVKKTELEKLTSERARLASERPQEMKEVTVTVRAERAGKVTVRIHYVVPEVYWAPTYDVHLYTDDARVRFTCYGLVTQASGEGWEGVKLTLARARPEYRLDVPETSPVVVSMDGAGIQQLVLDVRGLNDALDTQAWVQSRFQSQHDLGNFRQNMLEFASQDESFLAANGLSKKEIEQAIERIQDRFSSVRYDLAKPETILSDRSAHKVVIFSELLPARLKYVALPAAQSLVIRKAELANATSFPFLAGASNVFVDGSYVGAANVPDASANEELDLFFGPDDGLKVTRELVKRETKGPERFRQSQLVTYEFKIKVENFHGQEVEVELEDQIPISQSDDVQVKFLGASVADTKPDEKGILSFSLKVPARTPLDVTFGYQIEHPMNQSLLYK